MLLCMWIYDWIYMDLCSCFMEYQVLAEFVRVLKIGRTSKIEAPLLQYLSIMIQNMGSEHAICKMQVPLILMVNFPKVLGSFHLSLSGRVCTLILENWRIGLWNP